MVCKDASRNFYPPSILHIARGRLKEEERLLWDGVLQLLHMLGVIATNGNDLKSQLTKFTKHSVHSKCLLASSNE